MRLYDAVRGVCRGLHFTLICVVLLMTGEATAQSCYTISWGPWDASRTLNMTAVGLNAANQIMYVCRAWVPSPWLPTIPGYVYQPGVTTGQGYCAMYLANRYQAIQNFDVLYSDVPLTWDSTLSNNRIPTGVVAYNGDPFHSCRVKIAAGPIYMAGAQNNGSPATCWGVTFSTTGAGSLTTASLPPGDLLAHPAGLSACNSSNLTTAVVHNSPSASVLQSPSPSPQTKSWYPTGLQSPSPPFQNDSSYTTDLHSPSPPSQNDSSYTTDLQSPSPPSQNDSSYTTDLQSASPSPFGSAEWPSPDPATLNGTSSTCYTLSWGPWDPHRIAAMTTVGINAANQTMYVCRAGLWGGFLGKPGYIYQPGVTTGQGYCSMYLHLGVPDFEVLYSDVPLAWDSYPSSKSIPTGDAAGYPFYSCRAPGTNGTIFMAGAQEGGYLGYLSTTGSPSPSTCWGVTYSKDGAFNTAANFAAGMWGGDVLAQPAGIPPCNPSSFTSVPDQSSPNTATWQNSSPTPSPSNSTLAPDQSSPNTTTWPRSESPSPSNSLEWAQVAMQCPSAVFITTALNDLVVNWTVETWQPLFGRNLTNPASIAGQIQDPFTATFLKLNAAVAPAWKAAHPDVYMWPEAVVPIMPATQTPPPSAGIPAPLSYDIVPIDSTTGSSASGLRCSVNFVRAPLYGGMADFYIRLLTGPSNSGCYNGGIYAEVWGVADMSTGAAWWQLGPRGYVRSVVKFAISW